ncbi:hypothetical protein ACFE04_020786 [Oxalis oulophora]
MHTSHSLVDVEAPSPCALVPTFITTEVGVPPSSPIVAKVAYSMPSFALAEITATPALEVVMISPSIEVEAVFEIGHSSLLEDDKNVRVDLSADDNSKEDEDEDEDEEEEEEEEEGPMVHATGKKKVVALYLVQVNAEEAFALQIRLQASQYDVSLRENNKQLALVKMETTLQATHLEVWDSEISNDREDKNVDDLIS